MSTKNEVAKQSRDPRYPVEEAGVLLAKQMHVEPYLVTVLDVSRSGLRVRCTNGFPIGTEVTVSCRGADIFGTVRYSRIAFGDVEFNVGIQASRVATKEGDANEIDLTGIFRADTHLLSRGGK
jgi:hypothetical protein